jgi:hypothetical protein
MCSLSACLNPEMVLYLHQLSITDSQLGCLWLYKPIPVTIRPTQYKSKVPRPPFLASSWYESPIIEVESEKVLMKWQILQGWEAGTTHTSRTWVICLRRANLPYFWRSIFGLALVCIIPQCHFGDPNTGWWYIFHRHTSTKFTSHPHPHSLLIWPWSQMIPFGGWPSLHIVFPATLQVRVEQLDVEADVP